METKKENRGRPIMYEPSFTRKICEEFFQNATPITELAQKYNVSYGGIYRWITLYKEAQKELLSSVEMEITPPQPLIQSTNERKELNEENVQEELRLARIKITVLETMIDIAENQLKIEIRKKSGTKPSLE
ncbi:MAG TPA: hypothetical protein VKG26_07920 [Bacteroidia bacterium]|nr:hypothetical protein [Bacteroidia bacterium]